MRQVTIQSNQSNGWAPARFAAPASIGQAVGDPMPTTLVPPEPKKSFIDSSLLAALTAGAGAVALGVIARQYTLRSSKWASPLWLMAGISGFVALDDLSRARGR